MAHGSLESKGSLNVRHSIRYPVGGSPYPLGGWGPKGPVRLGASSALGFRVVPALPRRLLDHFSSLEAGSSYKTRVVMLRRAPHVEI